MEITLKVKGMHCNSCDMLITDALKETEGVNDVKADHKSGDVTVGYDEKLVNEYKLKSVIREEDFEVS